MFIRSRNQLFVKKGRYRLASLIVGISFLLLISRLVQLQLIDGEMYYNKSVANITRTVINHAVRGDILDSKGRVIATSRAQHHCIIMPHYFDMETGFRKLVSFLELDENQSNKLQTQIASIMADSTSILRFGRITVARDIDQTQLSAISAHKDLFPGVEIITVPVRHYPYAASSGHIIGYINEVNSNDIEQRGNEAEGPYQAGDCIGRSGLERALEPELRGVKGWSKILVDARGLPISNNVSNKYSLPDFTTQTMQPGNNVVLTIDMALQRIVDQALRGHPSGAVIVMDIHSGNVLASISKPSYDPNNFARGLSFEENRSLNENIFRPRIDKTVFEHYFPGSIFKPFVILAALQEGLASPEDVFHCKKFFEYLDHKFKCEKAHGNIDLRGAICQSCNVVTWKLADMLGMDIIARYSKDFGFGNLTNVGYNAEVPGIVPNREWYAKQSTMKFVPGLTLNMSIGQGDLKVTLMQLAVAYSAIANGGRIYRPQVVSRIESSDGDLLKDFEPEMVRQVQVSEKHLKFIIEAMTCVVEEEGGTAHLAFDEHVSVAGKTGTAQVARRRNSGNKTHDLYMNRPHAWFAAVAPSDKPEIAIITLIEHGGSGGRNAAPVGIEIARRYFEEIAPFHGRQSSERALETDPDQ